MIDESAFRKRVDRFRAEFCDATWVRWWRGAHFEAGSPPTIFVEPSRLSLLRSYYMARARSIFGLNVRLEPLPPEAVGADSHQSSEEPVPTQHDCP